MSATGAGQLHERVHVRSWIRTTTFLLLTLLRCQDATEYIRNHFGFPREAKNETRKIKKNSAADAMCLDMAKNGKTK